MKLSLRPRATLEPPGVVGPARVDRRFGSVVARAAAGDVVVLDHLDLDRAEAAALLERGVAAVVDAAPLISGRYPNLGPELLARGGVTLVDGVGSAVLGVIREGTRIRVHDGLVHAGDRVVASGRPLDLETVERLMAEAREGLGAHLQAFTHNTTELLRREERLLLHGEGLPRLRLAAGGRPALVVVPGADHADDLRRVRAFVKEREPVLVGVDAAADTLLEARLVPDLVVVGAGTGGDGWAGHPASDAALRAATEVVLVSSGPGSSATADRVDRLGVRAHEVVTGATPEDVALLLADATDAPVIVSAGAHATLEELLDRRRSGVASTFLTRLRVGPKLVDATALGALPAGGARTWQLVLLLLAGLLALVTALLLTPQGAPVAERLVELASGVAREVVARAGTVLP